MLFRSIADQSFVQACFAASPLHRNATMDGPAFFEDSGAIRRTDAIDKSVV